MPKERKDVMSMARELERRIQARTLDAGRVKSDIGVGPESIPCDLVESADAFHLTMDLPGIRTEDVKLSIQGRRLQVAANRSTMPEDETRRAVMVERAAGKLSRLIELPSPVDKKSAKMKYVAGVLSVTLLKTNQ